MFEFEGKSVLITGAGSGIGRATAQYFLECGASVFLADINERALQWAIEQMDGAPDRVGFCRYDASDRDSADQAIAQVVKRFGGLDFLVVGAGIYEHQTLAGMTDEQWHRMISVNLDGVFYVTRSAVPHLKQGSAIVTIASVAAHQGGTAGNTHYGATKGAILAFTRGLARELAPNVRANSVAPGWIETPMVARTIEQRGVADMAKAIPLGRIGQPREIASVIAFLCSDAASFVTGESIIAAGGAYMG